MNTLMALRGRWIASAAGAAFPLGFAPFDYYWLTPLLLGLLLLAWFDQPPKEAARRGFLFGAAAFIVGTYWLYISIRIFGGSPLWLALMLMVGLSFIMALYFALLGFVVRHFPQSPVWVLALVIFPAAWVLVEWLRGWFLTGFPWLSVGYGQIDGPLAAWAPLFGVYGVSFVTTTVAAAIVLILVGQLRQRVAALVVLAAILLATLGLQNKLWTRPDGPSIRVALVQGAIEQDRKWLQSQRRPTMELYRDLSFAQQSVDLVVWPEVAIPAMAQQVRSYLKEIDALANARGIALLLGILNYEADSQQFYNSLISLGQARGVYHKRHLVPFGEFFPVPDFVREWMRLMTLPYRDALRGDDDQKPIQAVGISLAPSICYEDAYGGEQRHFLPAAGLLVNVSNDAWFGDSIAPHQHLQIARMRALEAGRYMLRTTNTGITAIIDPQGRIVQGSPQFAEHVLRGEVLPFSGATPFVRLGNMPVLIYSLLVLAAAWLFPKLR